MSRRNKKLDRSGAWETDRERRSSLGAPIGGNQVIRGAYETTVLGLRRGVASDPRRPADSADTFFAEVIVNGVNHVVEFHLRRGVGGGYSGSVELSAAFPMSKDALPFLGALAERISRGESVAFPIHAVI